MKSLPRWAIIALLFGILGFVLVSVGHFAKKSFVFAEGSIQILPDLEDKAKNIRVLFITIFDADSPMPMPYGAQKVHISKNAAGQFYSFVLTKENIMIMNPQLPLPKKIRIKARLDLDGTAGMDKPGDLTGEVGPIDVGSTAAQITIKNLVGE